MQEKCTCTARSYHVCTCRSPHTPTPLLSQYLANESTSYHQFTQLVGSSGGNAHWNGGDTFYLSHAGAPIRPAPMVLLAIKTHRRRHTQSHQYVQEGEQKARWPVEGTPISLTHYLYDAAPAAAAVLRPPLTTVLETLHVCVRRPSRARPQQPQRARRRNDSDSLAQM
jgi:hypothetical protein